MRKRNEFTAVGSITDIHCHILTNIDDGAKSLEISVKMAQIALGEGITRIIATPHFDPDATKIEDFLARRQEAIAYLTSELKAQGVEIDILAGAEVYLTPSLLRLDGLERLCLGSSNFMLVEIPVMTIPPWLGEMLYSIQLKGIAPILAHPERNIKLLGRPKMLVDLVERGLMIQINASSFCEDSDRRTKKFIDYLIKNNMVHFLATDAHSAEGRSPKIQESISSIAKEYGDDIVEYILENARQIGNNRENV